MSAQKEKIDQVLEKLDEVLATLHGVPPAHDKGLIVRVDRMEQKLGVLSRLWWIAVTAVVGCVSVFWLRK